ncbi:uncharacterized protein LOC112541786 [Python bivittatus]|uniref:Uncharacterized protein LOC112541786 n=1 Tax=Python bivittatus TaxID=176946 RepID=A0A9F5IXC7_PYTBI|nr:uncharacterized protein LOC112541786 [Python bivittatus]
MDKNKGGNGGRQRKKWTHSSDRKRGPSASQTRHSTQTHALSPSPLLASSPSASTTETVLRGHAHSARQRRKPGGRTNRSDRSVPPYPDRYTSGGEAGGEPRVQFLRCQPLPSPQLQSHAFSFLHFARSRSETRPATGLIPFRVPTLSPFATVTPAAEPRGSEGASRASRGSTPTFRFPHAAPAPRTEGVRSKRRTEVAGTNRPARETKRGRASVQDAEAGAAEDTQRRGAFGALHRRAFGQEKDAGARVFSENGQ